MPRKFALLIGSYEFQDVLLQKLAAPASDIKRLSTVLENPMIGDFQTSILTNAPAHRVGQAIERFFARREREDILLLYFSGHGIKDERGRLHFASPDTQHDLLRTTSIPASLVNESMLNSTAKRQLLFLDCCYGGAFPKGLVAKSGLQQMAIDEQFQPKPTDEFRGSGRVILTSSDAMQYSFEGTGISGESMSSVFTRHLVEGLESGEADRNGDGVVGVDELFEYVQERMIAENASQTPVKWSFEVKNEIVVARSIRGEQPAALPIDLGDAVQSPWVQVRIGAIRELRSFLQNRDKRLANAARGKLQLLCEDDSRLVASEAQKVLSEALESTGSEHWVPSYPFAIRPPTTTRSSDADSTDRRSNITSRARTQAYHHWERYRDWRIRHFRLAIAVEMGLLWVLVAHLQGRANDALGVFVYHHLFTNLLANQLVSDSVYGLVFGAFVAATLYRANFRIGGRAAGIISAGWAVGFAIEGILFLPIMGPSGFLGGVQDWLV